MTSYVEPNSSQGHLSATDLTQFWTWSPESPCVSMNFSLSLLSVGGCCSDRQERENANTWPGKREKMQARDQARESEGVRERQRKRQVCLFQVVCTGPPDTSCAGAGWQSCNRATELWKKIEPLHSTNRIFRRILQFEILSHPTRKTHCRMNKKSRKFPEFASSVETGLGGEGGSQTRRKWGGKWLLKPKSSIDARQYATAFVTQCTLSLNDWEGSRAGLCQCGSFVMFCAPISKKLTYVSEKSYTPENPVRRTRGICMYRWLDWG